MTKRSFLAAVLFASFGVVSGTQATPDAQVILAASDVIRNPAKPFAVVLTLIEYRNRKQTDSDTLEVFPRPTARAVSIAA